MPQGSQIAEEGRAEASLEEWAMEQVLESLEGQKYEQAVARQGRNFLGMLRERSLPSPSITCAGPFLVPDIKQARAPTYLSQSAGSPIAPLHTGCVNRSSQVHYPTVNLSNAVQIQEAVLAFKVLSSCRMPPP